MGWCEIWLASQLVVLPMIGAGVSSSHMGGVRAAGTVLFGHLIYGPLLGWLAGGVRSAVSGSLGYVALQTKGRNAHLLHSRSSPLPTRSPAIIG
jgi:hypothetical protein